eukprot:TRINITY_DN1425_c0_g1_i2.p3 TRINITY_DN1425_c0_g1~~TRINITY_DN1425_c0_g1_i2.p3  ORF type:complete len:286 (+),score=138.38 TRINITY_DN1425_c0_g1_i2:425-1282(+)
MHKMVDKPNLIADDALNEKIERMFNNTLFQRMVERADKLQEKEEEAKDEEFPLVTAKAQELFIRRVAQEAKKSDEVPHFGGKQEAEIDFEPIATPVKEKKPEAVPLESGNESFGINENACKTPITETRKEEKKTEEKKDNKKEQREREERKEEGRKEERKKEPGVERQPEDDIDEYIDDEDMGFVVKEVDEEDFERMCKRLAMKHGYPARSIKPDPALKFKKRDDDESDDESSESKNDSATFDPALSKPKKGKEEKKSLVKKEGKGSVDDGINKLESLIKKVDDT